jgi:hypothetical protein
LSPASFPNVPTPKKLFYVTGLFLLPLALAGIYSIFLHGLSVAEIRQCLPYLGGDEPYNNVGPLQTIPLLAQIIFQHINADWINRIFCAVILLSGVQTLRLLLTRKIDAEKRLLTWLIIAYTCAFYVLNLHEFIKSGVFYRAFWAQPLSVFLTFTLIATAVENLKRWVRILLWLTLSLMVALSYLASIERIHMYKIPQQYLRGEHGHVYVGNNRFWLQTVALTCRTLKEQFKKEDLFFALPYDCLYYYLLDKKSPTRQLIFFDHIKIPPEQEQSIIAQLEAQHIAAVLVSSRQSAHEHGLGTLGVSYCPFITQYINTNFSPIAKIGDWVNEPGWAWNHGTLILKRK